MNKLQDERTAGVYGSQKKSKVSYGSVIAGALVGLVLLILFNMFGAGIGLGSLDITEESNPAQGLGTASIIWYIITGLIALFAAGWVSGRFARSKDLFIAEMHGILTWCVITLVSMYLVTSALGTLLGGAGQVIGSAASIAGKASGKVMEMAGPVIKEKGEEMDLSDIRKGGITNEAITIFQKADGNPDNVSKDDLTNLIMKSTELNRQQASARADSLISKYREASAKWNAKKEEIKAKAVKAADDAADAMSAAFIGLFIILVTGALAALLGARLGTQSRVVVQYPGRRSDIPTVEKIN